LPERSLVQEFPDEERFRAEHPSKNHTIPLPFRVRFLLVARLLWFPDEERFRVEYPSRNHTIHLSLQGRIYPWYPAQ
jgi:hypothetical protein